MNIMCISLHDIVSKHCISSLKAEHARTEEQARHTSAERARIEEQLRQKEAQIQQEQVTKTQLQEDKRRLTAELNSAQRSLQVANLDQIYKINAIHH